jgi:hypothetical protein
VFELTFINGVWRNAGNVIPLWYAGVHHRPRFHTLAEKERKKIKIRHHKGQLNFLGRKNTSPNGIYIQQPDFVARYSPQWSQSTHAREVQICICELP